MFDSWRTRGRMAALPTTAQTRRPDVTEPPFPSTKLKWGAPIWTLFHVLAQQIDATHFSRLRTELIDMIKTICSTLPCPDCSGHATQYLSRVNWAAIVKKEDLIQMLFVFHNTVNRRKNYPQFSADDLFATYAGMDFGYVVSQFLYHYEDRHSRGPNSAMSTKIYRLRMASQFKTWFSNNAHFFIKA